MMRLDYMNLPVPCAAVLYSAALNMLCLSVHAAIQSLPVIDLFTSLTTVWIATFNCTFLHFFIRP